MAEILPANVQIRRNIEQLENTPGSNFKVPEGSRDQLVDMCELRHIVQPEDLKKAVGALVDGKIEAHEINAAEKLLDQRSNGGVPLWLMGLISAVTGGKFFSPSEIANTAAQRQAIDRFIDAVTKEAPFLEELKARFS